MPLFGKATTATMTTDHKVCATNSLSYQDAIARGNIYRFLSAAFLSPPSPDFLEQIKEEDFLEELSTLFSEKMVAELKQFASTSNPDKDLSFLTQEYMDLFAVPTGRYVVPFEDVYRGITVDGKQEIGPLLGQRAIAVTRIYREAGAEMDRMCKELPTHIEVELSFLSFLCEREASANLNEEAEVPIDPMKTGDKDSLGYRELQIKFLQEHLNVWFPQLSQSIRANANSQYYRGLSLITEEFLAQDTAHLSGQFNPRRLIGGGFKETSTSPV